MTKQNWTPGPWLIKRRADGAADMIVSQIGDEDGERIPVVDYAHGGYIYAYEANARLIALAPEMAEALREISKGSGAFSRDPLTHASNVIDEAKATARAILARLDGAK